MVAEKTTYVEKTGSSNIKGDTLYRAGTGITIGGAAAVFTGVGMYLAAEASRPTGYVDYMGEENEVQGPIPKDMKPLYDIGLGMGLGGLGLLLSGPLIQFEGKLKREDEALAREREQWGEFLDKRRDELIEKYNAGEISESEFSEKLRNRFKEADEYREKLRQERKSKGK